MAIHLAYVKRGPEVDWVQMQNWVSWSSPTDRLRSWGGWSIWSIWSPNAAWLVQSEDRKRVKRAMTPMDTNGHQWTAIASWLWWPWCLARPSQSEVVGTGNKERAKMRVERCRTHFNLPNTQVLSLDVNFQLELQWKKRNEMQLVSANLKRYQQKTEKI